MIPLDPQSRPNTLLPHRVRETPQENYSLHTRTMIIASLSAWEIDFFPGLPAAAEYLAHYLPVDCKQQPGLSLVVNQFMLDISNRSPRKRKFQQLP